jgi:hypothetical protein
MSIGRSGEDEESRFGFKRRAFLWNAFIPGFECLFNATRGGI